MKAIKPVSQPSKKFYMLYDLEPAREITGGAWYVTASCASIPLPVPQKAGHYAFDAGTQTRTMMQHLSTYFTHSVTTSSSRRVTQL